MYGLPLALVYVRTSFNHRKRKENQIFSVLKGRGPAKIGTEFETQLTSQTIKITKTTKGHLVQSSLD